MITAGILQSSISVPPAKVGLLSLYAQVVIDLWEQDTQRLWNWRQGYVQRFKTEDPLDAYFWLKVYPVAEVISVQEWTPEEVANFGVFLPFGLTAMQPPSTEAAAVTTLTTDYDVDLVMGRINKTRFYPWATRVKATYSGGYAAPPPAAPLTVTLSDGMTSYTVPTTPPSVLLAMIVQAEFMIQRMAPEKIIMRSQSFKGGSAQFETADRHPFWQSAVAENESRVRGWSA